MIMSFAAASTMDARRLLPVFAIIVTGWLAGWLGYATSTIYGMTAAMTNTGFIALPVLHSIYGHSAVLPAAVATVFVAVVMFPLTVILLESEVASPIYAN